MTRACLGLLAGVYALHCSSFDRDGLVVFILVLALLVARLGGKPAALMYALGLLLFAGEVSNVAAARLDPDFAGDSLLTTVRIVDFPRVRDDTVSFVAVPLDDARVPARIRLSWYQAGVRPEIGDVWRFELRLRRPRGTSNPGVFDFETWLTRERIAATGYVVNGNRNRLLRSDAGSGLERLRKRLVDRIFDAIPDESAAAVVAAITVGARHRISDARWDEFATTGTSHLMAISGLHVGLAAAACYWVVLLATGLMRTRGNHHGVALPASAAMAMLYAVLSGAAVPALRATTMLLLLVIVVLRRRQAVPGRLLAAAAIVILVNDPLASLAPGFKLSFAAVALLVWAALRHRMPGTGGWPTRVRAAVTGLAGVQLLLLFGLAPLTVAEFQRIALAAPPVNLLAVPLFSFVTVPLALAGLLLSGPLDAVGDALLRLAALSVQGLLGIIRLAAGLPGAGVRTASLSGAAMALLALAATLALLPPGWPARRAAWLGLLAVIGFRVDGPPPGCFDVRVLDVGQGLAAVVRTRSHVLLYDTGAAFPGGSSMAERIVLPYLSGQGIRRIDRLVVSHADNDHAGGVRDIVAGMDVVDILAGESLPFPTRLTARCRRGDAWYLDGIEFRVLHPGPGPPHEGNDASCVLQVSTGERRYLLTGDIGRGVERQLVAAQAIAPSDVVVVPHHGSNTSSSAAFVDAVDASIAIVAVGFGNRWDLPRAEVMHRWRSAGTTVLRTDTDGAVHTRLCAHAGIVSVDRHRHANRRLWHESP